MTRVSDIGALAAVGIVLVVALVAAFFPSKAYTPPGTPSATSTSGTQVSPVVAPGGPSQAVPAPAPRQQTSPNTAPPNDTFGAPPSASGTIVNRNSSKCVEVNSFDVIDGATTQQWSCNGGANQTWTFVAADSGYYLFVNANSGKCLDIGDKVQQWACSGGTNQQWRLVPSSGGFFRLINRSNGKYLGVVNCDRSDPSGIALFDRSEDNCQQFRIR
jgi:hypothetical protein